MKIYLNGAENNKNLELMIEEGIKYVCFNHYQVRNLSNKKIEDMVKKAKDNGMNILIDSGSNSLIKAYKKPNRPYDFLKEEQIEVKEYSESYLKRIEIYNKYADLISELDIDELYEKYSKFYKEIRKEYIEKISKEKIIITPKRYNTVEIINSLENQGIENIGLNEYNNIDKLKAFRIHLWKRIKEFPIEKVFSISTSEWLNGEKYGITYHFDDLSKKMECKENKERRIDYKIECDKIGINWKKLIDDDKKEVRKWNLKQWKRFIEWNDRDGKNEKNLKMPETKKTENPKEEIEEIVKIENPIVLESDLPSKLKLMEKIESDRQCDFCVIKSKCRLYQENGFCRLNFQKKINKPEDLTKHLFGLLSQSDERLQFALLIEKMSEMSLNPNLTKEIKNHFELSKILNEISEPKNHNEELKIEAKSSQGGIIERIFGSFIRK